MYKDPYGRKYIELFNKEIQNKSSSLQLEQSIYNMSTKQQRINTLNEDGIMYYFIVVCF